MIIGKYGGKRLNIINDKLFVLASSLFVFTMGLSLGIGRALFQNALSIVGNSVVLSIIASLGSVLLISFISKLRKNKNV